MNLPTNTISTTPDNVYKPLSPTPRINTHSTQYTYEETPSLDGDTEHNRLHITYMEQVHAPQHALHRNESLNVVPSDVSINGSLPTMHGNLLQKMSISEFERKYTNSSTHSSTPQVTNKSLSNTHPTLIDNDDKETVRPWNYAYSYASSTIARSRYGGDRDKERDIDDHKCVDTLRPMLIDRPSLINEICLQGMYTVYIYCQSGL